MSESTGESRGEVFRVQHSKEHPYRIVAVATFADETISWTARGVLGYLLTRPDGWEVAFWDLVARGDIKRDKMRSVIRELRAGGYMKRKRIHTSGGRFKWVTDVFEDPLPVEARDSLDDELSPSTDLPSMVKKGEKPPSTDLPSVVAPSTVGRSTVDPSIYKEENIELNESKTHEEKNEKAVSYETGQGADAPAREDDRDLSDAELDTILAGKISTILSRASTMSVAQITALGKREKKVRDKPRQTLLRDLRSLLNERRGRVLIPSEHVTDLQTAIDLVTVHEKDKAYTVRGSYGGILAALYTLHFTADVVNVYPPDPARLAGLLPLVHQDARLLLQLIHSCDPAPEGDPHRFLRGRVRASAGISASERKDGNESGTRFTQYDEPDKRGTRRTVETDHVATNAQARVGQARNGSSGQPAESLDIILPTGAGDTNPYPFNSPRYKQFERERNRLEQIRRGRQGPQRATA